MFRESYSFTYRNSETGRESAFNKGIKDAMTAVDGFSKYIPPSEDAARWELMVTDCGWTHIPPDSPYPPGKHPENYTTNLQTGRVLQEEQIVYITRGEGTFWSEHSGKLPIRAGSVFLLFPGVRHSYRPHPSTGWDEHWVGFTGDYGKRLMERFFSPKKPVLPVGNHPGLLDLFKDISTMALHESFGYRPIVAAKTIEIMARLVARSKQGGARSGEKERIVRDACCLILDSIDKDIDFKAYAAKAGVSYSSLRRLFREHTGLPLNQYLLEIRVRKAKELLVNTDLKMQPIAEACGLENVNYFSRLFKARAGCSPLQFRKNGST